jgi:alanyl-tRNA synthetase
MGDQYKELVSGRQKVIDTVREEEERFSTTLGRGLVHLDDEVKRLGAGTTLPGDIAFRLYDTYGFPVDMTADILRSRGIAVDQEGFESALEQQRERGRGAQAAKGGARDYTLIVATARERGVRYAGQEKLAGDSRVVGLARGGELVASLGEGDEGELVVEETPFYGESGGQVGDTGTIESAGGSKLVVVDTQKPAPDVVVHIVRVTSGRIAVGDEVTLRVDAARRQAIRLNHSATHLMHAALRHHLGNGVHQQGSLVDPTRLRFDFNHSGPVADEKLADIEAEANEAIRANYEVTVADMKYDDAIAAGAMAFFGDKYGDVVRVLKMGDYSIELCGGTHVDRTGDIGLLRLASESGVAAGVRRIEASTGANAFETIRRRDEILREIAGLLKIREEDTVGRIEKLIAESRELEKKLVRASQGQSRDVVADLAASAKKSSDGASIVVSKVDGIDSKSLRSVCDRLRERLGPSVVVLAAESDDAASVLVAVSPDRTGKWNANDIIRQLVPFVDGRGGGKPDFAQAGGKNPAGIAALLEKAHEIVV